MIEIIVALIALIGTLGGSLGGILVSSKMTNYRLQQLENRVATLYLYSPLLYLLKCYGRG